MDTPVKEAFDWAVIIKNIIAMVTKVLASGPWGIGLSIGFLLLLGVGGFFLRAKIMNFLRGIYKNISDWMEQRAREESKKDSIEQEEELAKIKEKLKTMSEHEKVKMLNGLDDEKLLFYARKAFGDSAIDTITKSSTSSHEVRVKIYDLYINH